MDKSEAWRCQAGRGRWVGNKDNHLREPCKLAIWINNLLPVWLVSPVQTGLISYECSWHDLKQQVS